MTGPRRSGCGRAARPTLVAVGLLAGCVRPLAAQNAVWEDTDTGRLLAANAVAGAVVVAVHRMIRGEPPLEGLLVGTVGGAVSFSGRLVAARTPAGIAGRSIAAVGHSLMADSIRGRKPWSRLELPVGPLWLDFPLEGDHSLEVDVDLPTTLLLGWGLVDPDVRIDWQQWLSRGAIPLVVAHGFDNGATIGAGVPGGLIAHRTFRSEALYRHEMLHVIELDFVDALVGRPVDEWVWTSLRGGRRSFLRLGLTTTSLVLVAHGMFPEALEVETDYLAPYY